MAGKTLGAGRSEKDFAQVLREELDARGWPQKQLAETLGKHDSTVSLWLAGKKTPKPQHTLLLRLADFLRSTPEEVRELLGQPGEVGPDREVPPRRVIRTVEELDYFVTALWPELLPVLVPANDEALPDIRERIREKNHDVAIELLKALREDLRRGDRVDTAILHPSSLPSDIAAPARDDETLSKEDFRALYRRDSLIRDEIRQMCRELNRRFAATEHETLDKTDIVRTITEYTPGANNEASWVLGEALFQGLLDVRFIEERAAGSSGYRRRWHLSSSFLINRLFGVEPQITGFSFLLDGGLLPTSRPPEPDLPDKGLTILVQGEPGVGKTMLSLQLAASLAMERYAVIYLSAEESLDFLTDRLSYAGYTREKVDTDVDYIRKSGRTCQVVRARLGGSQRLTSSVSEKSDGTLLLYEVPNRTDALKNDSALRKDLNEVLSKLQSFRIPACVVVDSVDAMMYANRRRVFDDICALLRRWTEFSILVGEYDPSRRQLREHLVDMVIRLGYRGRNPVFTERVIEVRKCRTQSHIRGQHMLSIHSGDGIAVYPSVQSRLSIWRRRVRKLIEPAAAESWRLDEHFDYDSTLGGDIVEGDSILLEGPPATHKFPVGLSFLASGLLSQKDGGALLISLREDQAAIERIIRSYPQMEVLAQALPTSGAAGRLEILHLPPDYFSAERFLYWVWRSIAARRNGEWPVRRALFSTLSQLQYNSPMFVQEPLFVAALIELFKKERITSLFLSVESSRDREIGNIFDTILYTSRQKLEEGDVTHLTVGHSGPCNARPDPRRLTRDALAGGGGRLKLGPAGKGDGSA